MRSPSKAVAGASLGATLLALTSLLAILPLAASSILASRAAEESMRKAAIEKNRQLASSLAHDVGTFLQGYFGALALMDDFAGEEGLGAVMRAFPAFDGIYRLDRRGTVIMSAGLAPGIGFDLSLREDISKALATKARGLSPSTMSPLSYTPLVDLSVPSKDGITVGALSLASLSRYVAELPRRGDDIVAVADSFGYLVAHTDAARVDRRESVAVYEFFGAARLDGRSEAILENFEGRPALVSAVLIPGSGWIAISAVPTSIVTESSRRIATIIFLSSGLLGLAALAVAGLVIGLIRKEVATLVAAMHAASLGREATRSAGGPFREFNLLAADFGSMSVAIKEREEGLRETIVEKEVLLKEVHHRVKNNLQLVESLLSLGARASPDGSESPGFAEAIARVDAMARIHEMLYQSSNLSSIELGPYLRDLVEGLALPCTASFDFEPVYVDLDRAIPCGLMANEVLLNAAKHALGPGRGSRIELVVRPSGTAGMVMEIGDDGPGLPPGFDPGATKGLGMQLIVALSLQLGARWSVLSEGRGTRWRFEIPG